MTLTLLLPAALLLAAAACDLRTRLIPDAISVALALTGALAALNAGGPSGLAQGAALAAVVFVGGAAMHHYGQIGGGDVKLAAALAPWLTPLGVAEFLLVTSMVGGGLGLGIAVGHFAREFGAHGRAAALRAARGATAPYAVAIAAGGIVALPWPAVGGH